MRVTRGRSTILLVVIGVLLYTTALALQWDDQATLMAGLTGAILALIWSRNYQKVTVTPYVEDSYYVSCRDVHVLEEIIKTLGLNFHQSSVVNDKPGIYKYMVYWKKGRWDLVKKIKSIS